MPKFCFDGKYYKEHFNEKSKIKNDEFVYVKINGIKSLNDNECEYSIKWKNLENSNEKGFIYKINTSSCFSANLDYFKL